MAARAPIRAIFEGSFASELLRPLLPLSEGQRVQLERLIEGWRRLVSRAQTPWLDPSGAPGPQWSEGLQQLGLPGLPLPASFGGLGLGASVQVRLLEEVAGFDASLAFSLGAHWGLGLQGLLQFGTLDQQRRWFPSMVAEGNLAAFALTEPAAGTDAAAIATLATPTEDGTHWRIRGSKTWVTNAARAGLFTVVARTSPPGEASKPKLTAFLVPPGAGLQLGAEPPRLGLLACSSAELRLEDVLVPSEAILGAVGQGASVASAITCRGRLALAALCVGLAKKAVGLALQRATARRAFGRSIGEFAQVKDSVASMLAWTFAIESMTGLTAARIDRGEFDGLHESTACKILASEALGWIVDQALQLAGGEGYLESGPYAPLYRDARAFRIVGGTNETLRGFLVLSAGLAPQGHAASAPVSSSPWKSWGPLGQLGEKALQRARSALGGDRFEQGHPLLRREVELFELHAAQLAERWAHLVARHGRELPELQVVQRSYSELVLDAYALGACLARTHRALERRGEQGSRRELELTWVFASMVRRRARQVFLDLEEDDQSLRRAVAARAYADRAYPFEAP